MEWLFLILCISIFLGALIGSYCQLYYSAQNVIYSWSQLSKHALRKRKILKEILLLTNLSLNDNDVHLDLEIDFLEHFNNISWKSFLKDGYDIITAFKQIEDGLANKQMVVMNSLENSNHLNQKVQELLEELWATDNLLSFEGSTYTDVVDKYLKLRKRSVFFLARNIFCFADLPIIRFE